jgi:hypothetical protein
MFIAIAVALASLAVAIASWFRPAPEPQVQAAPTFTDAQVADAKKNVCDAFKHSADAIGVTASRNPGTDVVTTLATLAHTRIAALSGPQYLLNVLSDNPATPDDLAKTAREYSLQNQKIALELLATKPTADIDPAMVKAADTAHVQLTRACT